MISANTLFHFTSKLSHLENILENSFSPRYCLEVIHGSTQHKYDDFEGGLPMVCFCDIPLSQTIHHMSTYGEYGIGFTKEWGLRNKITPVLYYYKDSPLFDSYQKTMDLILKTVKPPSEIFDEITRIGLYSKPYKGKFFRNGSYLPDDVHFYNEREWRFVPSKKAISKIKAYHILDKRLFKDPASLEQNNKQLEKIKITFTPNDIRYIILKKEEEIHALLDKIRNVKGSYSYRDVELLTTRIITSDQIRNDF